MSGGMGGGAGLVERKLREIGGDDETKEGAEGGERERKEGEGGYKIFLELFRPKMGPNLIQQRLQACLT